MDQAPIMPKNWKPSQKTSAPVMPKDWGKEEVDVEKKKPTELPSPLEKPTALSVAGLHPMVPSSASKSVAPKPEAEVVKPIANPIVKPIAAPQENVSVTGSQGKLLIPEKKIKFPAVTEKVTTYKKVPVLKTDDNLPLNPELMLKAIFKNEQGTLGKTTSIKASGGMRNTASGTYQMTDETKRDVFNRNDEFKKQFGNYNSFLKEFNKNPSLEFQAALSHMTNLAKQYGKYALAAWYSPTHAAQAAKGNLRALNTVPRRDAGNKRTVRSYYNDAIGEYNKLIKNNKSDKDYIQVPVKTETIKEPAVEVPSLEKYDVTNKNWYPGPTKEDVNVLAKNTLQKSKDVALNIKLFNSDANALAQDVNAFNQLAKSNPKNPNLPALQKQLEERKAQIDANHSTLQNDIKSIDDAKMEVNRQAVENYKSKASQGNWGGFAWNKIIEGLGNVQRGVQEQAALWSSLGAQTLDLFGVKSEELKKKPWLLAGGGDMYRREKVREYQDKVKGYNEALKSEGTTPEYMQELEKESSWAQALGGVASSAPAMVGGLPSMVFQGMGAFYNEVDNDAVLKNLPRNEMDMVAIPIGIGTAWLEETGLKKILGKGTTPVAKILTKVFKKIPKNAAMDLIEKTFKEIAESEAGKIVKKVGNTTAGKVVKRFASGALGEAETEPEQGALEDAVKSIYNWSKDNEAFKVAKFNTDEYNQKRIEEAKLGAMGSLIMGAPIMAVQAVAQGKKITDDDFVAMRDLLNDPEHITLTRTKLALDVVDEKITPAQAQQQLKEANKTREILNSIPTNLPVKAQREAFQILWNNAKLNEDLDNMSKSIVDKDPNLVTSVTDKMKKVQSQIEENNKQLTKISKDAVQEQTTSEVPIQPEAGAGVQVAEGEPQAEPQVPTEEGQVEEVTVTPGIATIDVTTPTKFEEGQMPEMSVDQIDWEASGLGSMQEAIDKFGGINDITVVDIQGKNDKGQYVGNVRVLGQDTSKEGLIVFKDPNAPAQEVVEPEVPKTRADKVKQMLFDKGVYPVKNRVDGLAKLSEENPGAVTGDQVLEVLNVSPTKAGVIATALNNQVKQEAKQAEKETKQAEKQVTDEMNDAVNTAIETAKSEGLTKDLVAEAGIEALKNTNAYKDADQQQRDVMEDNVRKKAGVKRKAAPSVKKVLGIKPDLVTVNDAVARNEQIRLEIKAAKGAAKAVQEAVAKLVADIKALGQKGKLTPSQTNALLNGLKSNLLNPVIRDQVFARAKRIIENVNYAKKVEDGNSIRKKIRDIVSADKKRSRKDKLAGAVTNMASKFAKLSPKMVDDIDLYLERANEVLAAIRNPKITDMEITGRVAADIAAVNEYAESEFDNQEETRKDEILAQYEYLVEAGVLDKSMSLSNINKVIAGISEGKDVGNENLKEDGLVFYRTLFNNYADIIKKMLSGTDPITGEPTNISEGDKELVRRFLKINPENVSDLTDMFNMANAAQEFITNGLVDNMEVMVRHYIGKENVKKNAENPKMRGYKAILPWVANIAKIPLFTNIINTKLAPVQEYLRNVFRGETNAATFEKDSGFTDIVNGSTKALGESDSTDKSYAQTFEKKKPNGEKFFDVTNVFERGIFADLFRKTPGTVEETQAEFNNKKQQLELTIKEKENSDKKSDNREAKELQKAYDKIVKGSNNINDVMSKMAQENIDGVMWWIDKWDEYFDKIDRASKALYNTPLDRQINYTPEGWVKIADKTTQDDDMLTRSFSKMNMSYLDTRRAGTLMKYNGAIGLPKNKNTQEVTHVKSYHFDINNSESFGKTLKDVYTAPGMVQYMAYVNSPEFSTIIPDNNTRENLKEKLAFAINSLKDSEIDISPDFVKNYNKAMKKFVDISRAQALVSIKTPILQTVPVIVGTAVDLMNDPASYFKGFAVAANTDFNEALNKSGYGIAVRGLEAIAAMDAAEKRIAESNGVDFNLFSNIAKLGNTELKWMLSKPDIVAARQAWAAYYVHKLNSMGINTSNIDWNTHEFNEEAANYAERKTSSKLNQNIQELSGKVFASRSQTNRAIRNIVLNFASFSYNMKYRFWTDMVVLGSKNSNSMDKADAAKDIVRTVGESALYIYINSILAYWIKQGIYNLIGYDEPEEEKKKADEYLTTNMLTKGLVDLFSPMPGIGDLLFVKGVNSLADLVFGEQEEEQPNKEKLFFVKERPEVKKQFRLYEPPEKTEAETYLSLLGGMSSIYLKNVYDVYKTASLINEGETVGPIKLDYKDKYDNKIEFSNKEKEMMKIPFYMQSLETMGIGVRDQTEAARKVRGALEKRARKRTATSKKEKLFYVKKAE